MNLRLFIYFVFLLIILILMKKFSDMFEFL